MTAALAVSMRAGFGDHPLLTILAFAALTVATVVTGVALRRHQRRARTLRGSLLVVTLSSLVIAVAAGIIAGRLMFVSNDELVAFLLLLTVAAAFASLLAVVISRPLRDDVRHLESTVRRIEAGDRSIRVDSSRADELGHVGRAIDDLVDQLMRLERERSAVEEERRTLLSNIGHDLRSPLAALQAAIEAMVDGVAPDPARYLRSMQHDVEALGSLIDDLYLLARLDAGRFDLERVPIDLVELADGAVESLTPMAQAADVGLLLDAGDPVHVVGSPVSLSRVIRNLIDNGIRHAPVGSTVRVSVSADGGAVVRVADDGPGFPSAFRDQAFDRFTRADPSRNRQSGGGGLGLAIARGLVEAHGGEIWIEDGATSLVAFRIPVQRHAPSSR
ncbi:MAG: HAMP domain-containing sensor histidine kinase [Ilumatobacteraceae bacterium]